MQVIERSVNEGIVIDDDVIVTVLETLGDKVRLQIECPREVPVHRGEVFAAIEPGITEPEIS